MIVKGILRDTFFLSLILSNFGRKGERLCRKLCIGVLPGPRKSGVIFVRMSV